MLKNILFLFVLLSLTHLAAKAQNSLSDNDLYISTINKPNIVSPNVAAIEKYGDIPVGHYTGTAQVTIPVFTLEGKGISVPISLSYHTGGIKVEEMASRVGLGWSLSAGGTITRKINGIADEGTPMGRGFFRDTAKISTYYNNYVNNQYISLPQGFTSMLRDVRQGYLDGEPDLFSCTAPGLSCKFMFNQDLSQFIPYPFSTTKIETSKGFYIWTVIDDKGNRYTFKNKEQNYSVSRCNMGYKPQDTVTTAWYLTKIENANRTDSIVFTYENVSYTYKALSSSTKYYPKPAVIPQQPLDQECFTDVTMSGQTRLTAIEGRNGRIEFIKSTSQREDLPGDYSLSEIVIKNSSDQVIKRVKFNYGYYNSANSVVEYKRLKLLSVEELDSAGQNETAKKYLLDYNTTALPSRLSYSQDHWGYYNGKPNSTLIPDENLLLNVKKYTGDMTSPNEDGLEVIDSLYFDTDGADRTADTVLSQAGILKKITYPTGGSTEFVYENNKVRLEAPPYHLLNPLFYTTASGVIISEMINSSQSFQSQYIDSIEINEIPFPGNDYREGALVNIQVFPTCAEASDLNCPQYILEGPEGQNVILNSSIGTFLPNGKYYLKVSRLNGIPADDHGMRSFTFGLNYQKRDSSKVNSLMRFCPVGGLRIKEVIAKDANNVASKKIYNYEMVDDTGALVSSGLIHSRPSYITPEYIMTDLTMPNYLYYRDDSLQILELSILQFLFRSNPDLGHVLDVYGARYQGALQDLCFKISSNSSRALTDENGYVVGYNKVKEIQQGDEADLVTEYRYTNFDKYHPIYSNTFPNSFSYDEYWRRGNPLNTLMYDNGTTLKQQDKKGYEFPFHYIREDSTTLNPVYGISIARNMWHVSSTINKDNEIIPLFDFYFHVTEDVNLKADTITYYASPTDSLSTTTSFVYGKNGRLVQSTIVKSTGETRVEESEYPTDFLNTATVTSAVKDSLISRNMLSALLKKTVTVNNNEIQKITYEYGLHNNKIFLDSVMQSLRTAPLSKEVDYSKYDDQGNLLSVTAKDGVITSFLWGYNNMYPVAQVQGADHATISGLINQSILDNTRGQYTDENIKTELNKIRTGLAGTKALVTTYTYAPLIGMTSQTDVNNRTTYYEYDGFGRLSLIRDQDGNILKKVCYNYAGQPEDCGMDKTPLWQSTGVTRCKPCPANSAYISNIQQHEEKDNNPYSTSYNSTRWVDDGVSASCVPAADWQQIDLYCEQNTGQNTGNQIKVEQDKNPCSPTYNQTRNTTTTNCTTCPKPASWQPTGNYRCVKDASNENTGYQEREEKDMESCSSTYNQLRWVSNGYNTTACPLPAVCTNCTGEDKKCINGTCQTGAKIYTSSVQSRPGHYECTYHYEWSDGSWSQNYTEYSTTFCPLTAN